jgi:hypothetical protein
MSDIGKTTSRDAEANALAYRVSELVRNHSVGVGVAALIVCLDDLLRRHAEDTPGTRRMQVKLVDAPDGK